MDESQDEFKKALDDIGQERQRKRQALTMGMMFCWFLVAWIAALMVVALVWIAKLILF